MSLLKSLLKTLLAIRTRFAKRLISLEANAFASYLTHVARAADFQNKGDWKNGLHSCVEAMHISKNGLYAKINATICLYHLDHLSKAVHELEHILPATRRASRLLYYSVRALALVVLTETKNYDRALTVALELLDSDYTQRDLRTVPIALYFDPIKRTVRLAEEESAESIQRSLFLILTSRKPIPERLRSKLRALQNAYGRMRPDLISFVQETLANTHE